MPAPASASCTALSLNGLMIASIFFMPLSSQRRYCSHPPNARAATAAGTSNGNASVAGSKRSLPKEGSAIYREVDTDLLKDGRFIGGNRDDATTARGACLTSGQ